MLQLLDVFHTRDQQGTYNVPDLILWKIAMTFFHPSRLIQLIMWKGDFYNIIFTE